MPRVTIEYGDEEQAAAREALEASRMACALREIDEQCRAWMKRCDCTDQERSRLHMLRDLIPEIVREG
jgi:hypothetical protein